MTRLRTCVVYWKISENASFSENFAYVLNEWCLVKLLENSAHMQIILD